MTAIAGIVSFRSDLPLDRICASALAAQAVYGTGRPAVRHIADAALGIDLFPTLPEDQFDRQPLSDGRFLLVADVRLDNRDELLAGLGASPRQFAEQSDAEILLLAWQRWEEDCLQRIVGDFAFAVYDRHHRQLTLARDASGSRPLCYLEEPDGLRLASMPSGVAGSGKLKPDLTALAIRMADRLAPGWTCFENVRAVPPGELVRFSPTGTVGSRHWNPSRDYQSGRPFEQDVAEFRSRLDDAVGARMRRSSSPLAMQLSSGYDSSAVTGTAVRLQRPGDRLIAFTSAPAPGFDRLQFRGRIADESAIAASTAAALGIEHVVIRDGSPLLDAMRGYSRFYQEPVGNIFNQGWWSQIAVTAAAMGAGTMLSGAIGNFTISHGSLTVLPYWLRTGRWSHWLREARSVMLNNDVRWRGVLLASFDPWLPRQLVGRIEKQFLGASSQSGAQFIRRELADAISKGHCARNVAAISGDPFTDRLTMIRSLDFGQHRKGLLAQTGIDERDPTSDRRLVEFCLSMPPEQLLDRGIYRPVARAALADRVPHQILEQRTRGYQGADWFARLRVADMQAIMEEISASGAAELLDLAEMKRAIDAWRHFDASESTRVARLGRSLTDALAAGMFVAEVERDPASIGKANNRLAAATVER